MFAKKLSHSSKLLIYFFLFELKEINENVSISKLYNFSVKISSCPFWVKYNPIVYLIKLTLGLTLFITIYTVYNNH